jgi:hypothetical protein
MFITICLTSIFILILPSINRAETWQADLINTGKVQTDAKTHKPTVTYKDNSTQLWDGVHTLQDGSIIIVKDGVIIPNEAMYHAWSKANNINQTTLELNPCELLTRRVCGVQNSCANQKACKLAQQLQKLWENAPDATKNLSSTGKNECHKALIDPVTFSSCDKETKPPEICTRLVTQVCGENNECKDKPACNVAQQLLKLAHEVILKNIVNEIEPEQDCREAINNHFFVACRNVP